MEVDYVTSDILDDEETVEFDDSNGNFSFDGERCGICMDIVIDRGVIDCCQHWFCFGCIDNWSTITNLCPLCQKEFQLITCVPVYDTVGSNNVDEDSLSRDDDWSVEGTSNDLSFPSYYIDENAVTCLDGDSCKVRCGSALVEEDSNLDTSIACDSCDIWYHAYCVGFDTEGTSDETWLCPRCTADESPQKTDVNAIQRLNFQHVSEASDMSCLADDTFAGKMSVSVADAGETAIVVSMVRGDKCVNDPNQNSKLSLKAVNDLITDTVCPDSNSIKNETWTREETGLLEIMDGQALDLSLSNNASFRKTSNSSRLSEFNVQFVDGAKDGPSTSSHAKQSESESSSGLCLGLSVGSFHAVDMKSNDIEDKMMTDVHLQSHFEESGSRGQKENNLDENAVAETNEQDLRTIGLKRKGLETSDINETPDGGAVMAKDDAVVLANKVKLQRKLKPSPETQVEEASLPGDLRPPVPQVSTSVDTEPVYSQEEENATIDIMSIIKDTSQAKRLARKKLVDKSLGKKENAAGLRVKKIMRRASEDKDSTNEVQKLRKEIREAVRNKFPANNGENLFDPKLLAAFRSAVTGPINDPVKKLPPAALRAKKVILQKSKIRENLTKKIYGNSNGKRRRAWDRDCEVEFWKHRCLGATKPEKVATLKSVLNLLKKNPEDSVTDQASESSLANPILSRLYLADTSVFPRKADIKPLSDFKAPSHHEQNKVRSISSDSAVKPSSDDHAPKNNETSTLSTKITTTSSQDKVLKNKLPSSQGKAEGSSKVPSSGPKVSSHKEAGVQSDDKKIDKRKWALEVLARKKAASGSNLADEKQGDNAALKKNYPLLAQLPADMIPVLAPSSLSKVPVSVRQNQLYRLADHFLKKISLPEIRRTAETELAVADAINIEKAVADRSSSKVVYLNLCSQEILHFSDRKSVRDTEANSSTMMEIGSSDNSLDKSSAELPTDAAVLDALKNTGLLSDSPPGSPSYKVEVADEVGDSTLPQKENGPENVFEIDSHHDVDIYGDFEYDLEDEAYIGVSAKKASKSDEEADLKVKLVLSTVKPDVSQQLEDQARQGNIETGSTSSPLPKSPSNVVVSSTMEGSADKSPASSMALPAQESEEPSLAECEELYGPDTEPFVSELPKEVPEKPNGIDKEPAVSELPEAPKKPNSVVITESVLENNNSTEAGNDIGSEAKDATIAAIGDNSCCREKSPCHSQTSENIPRKDKYSADGKKKSDSADKSSADSKKKSDNANSISKKVEAYIKEHIRPLCKSGVITVEQYRWAVTKTTDKVMKYHANATTANFLIREGEKVKKLAEQYIQQAQHKEKGDR